MVDVVTFGETMIRLSPPDFRRLEQTTCLDVHVGGAELNVAIGASRLGMPSAWVSKVPDNPLGRMICNKAREHGVDTSAVIWDKDGRAGLYFLEFGATPRASSVLYDRNNSSFSTIQPGQVDWMKVLGGARCLHLTGITPAVSASAAAATLEALQVAARLNCKVSLDLNYRAKLWSPEAARRTLTPMMEYVHILITTMGDSQTILGVDAGDEDELSRVLLDRFPLEVTALSIREGDAVLRCRFSAMARTRAGIFTARRYDIDIIDQLGRGDSFAAGFLYGYLRCGGVQPGLDYGVAFAALKHSSPGDINWCTRQEVEDLLAGPRPGVSR